MKRIMLIGVGDLRNYGCEAIVRGTYEILQQSFSSFTFTVAVANPSMARMILKDLPGIRLVEDRRRFSIYRVYRGFLRRFLHIGNGSPVRLNYSLADDCDLLLLGGGDNICMTSEGTLLLLCLDLLKTAERTVNHGGKYVLWGASSGPFTDECWKIVCPVLKKASGLFIREEITRTYLTSKLPGQSVLLFADPAFAMRLPENMHSPRTDTIRVGLNLSRLALWNRQDKLNEFCQNMVEWGHSNYIDELVLIPHVMTDENGPQNDYCFLQEIQTLLTKHNPDFKVLLLPRELGALRTKAEIANLEFLIASRMHCCVAGCSFGIPTVFLTYSIKGEGMCRFVYEGKYPSFTIEEVFGDEFFKKLTTLFEKRSSMKKILCSRRKYFYESALAAGKALNEL